MVDQKKGKKDEIVGIWKFLKSIEWNEKWIVGMIFLNVVIKMMKLIKRKKRNLKVMLLIIILLIV